MRLPLILLCAMALNACGYGFQGVRNPLQKLGIETIYVENFKNSTFRPGLEQMFTTAMLREIEKAKAFRLVNSVKKADAVLTGEIQRAESAISSTKGLSVASQDIQVGSEYSANVTCFVVVRDLSGRVIFSQSIAGSKVYPGSVLTGSTGATVPLVNESEQRLAYQYLSTQLMASVYQRMIDIF